ncbi:C39 family peptidase [Methanococcoides seepicolus]|uniref:C39 family peptidase n=1 Tax=Methanococcoides seepicolus TaxID=2828780 RepID=A0A9E4ZEU2_9EURY|nr:C39 family peptidase [Methanococcoides seepicolus]MCM1986345.1 C39 family peptidase [Methanococcoides seepicolus]
MRTKEMRIVTLTLIAMFVVIMAVVPVAMGQENEFSTEKEYGELFLKNMGQSKKLINPIPLNNINGDLEAVSFSMKDGGYIIINVNDLSVPEFSLESNSPFSDSTRTYVYNGPLAYMEDKQGKLFQIGIGDRSDEAVIPEYIYAVESVDKDKKLADLKTLDSRVSVLSVNYGSSLDYSLKEWIATTTYNCGPTAAAITLDYFDDHHNNAFIPSQYESQSALFPFLTPDYIPNDAILPQMEQGLFDILFDHGLNSYDAESKDYVDYNKIISLINSDKPVIVGLDNHPTYGYHWVVTHGYYVETVPWVTPHYYIIVNDGAGNNNVYILVDGYVDDMVYIE